MPVANSTQPQLFKIARTGISVASAVSIAVGLLWIIAWLDGTAARWAATSIITVKTNAAICLFLSGLSLLLVWRKDAGNFRKTAGGLLGILVLLTGLLTLSQHLFGIDLRIDQLLVSEPSGARATARPNRMGLPASSCFTLIGIGVLSLAVGRRSVAPICGLVVALIMSVPVVGYLIGIAAMYDQAALTGIAWSTVLGIMSIAGGLMLANDDGPPLTTILRDDPGGALLRRLLPAAIALPLIIGILRTWGERYGLYGSDTGRGLLIISMIIIFSAVLWKSSAWLSRLAAVERAAAEQTRKAAERLQAAAIESERARMKLAAVFDSVSEGVMVLDVSGTIVMVNNAKAKLNGFDKPEEMLTSIAQYEQQYDVFDASGAKLDFSDWPIRRVISGQSIKNMEIKLRRKDTAREWIFNLSGEPVRDESGKQILGVIVTRDISEQKKREAQLLQSEGRFRGLAEGMPHAVWETDSKGINFYQNQVWYDYIGHGPGSSYGSDWMQFYHPEDQQRLRTEWTKSIKSGGTHVYDVEARIRRHDGVYRWFRIKGAPIRDGDGNIVRWVGTCTDIEDQKRIAQELEADKKAAEEASRAKDHFLAVLGHELRNPLAPIRNAVEVMKRLGLSNPLQERARQIIERQAEHMTRLIEELLDVSRIERGKITLQKEDLNLFEVVSYVVEDNRALAESAGLSLQFSATDVPVHVFGDAARLTQVVGNLLNNAIKFTDRGGKISVEVALASESDALVTVRDTGIGLDAGTLETIFEPFSQEDRSLERSRGGLGLGLALVRGLIKLHGGDVKASSPGLGKGSSFVVRLPVLQRAPELSDETTALNEPARAQRVLIVDDNVDAAETLSEMLNIFGHHTKRAHSGREALQIAAEFKPQVILCDISMPGMNGYDVAQAIRNDPNLKSIYLIAMTGYGQEEDKRRAVQAGFDHHITKPAEPEMLERLLAR